MIFTETGLTENGWLFPMITVGIFVGLLITIVVISFINHHHYRDAVSDRLDQSRAGRDNS